jgi:hypothetical protein
MVEQQRAFAADAFNGIYLTFESDPGFELKLDSLDHRRTGIELCSVRQEDDKTLATVFVPDGKLGHFVHLVEAYAASETATGKPKNRALIESVSHIRLAALQALWTDEPNAFPRPDEPAWWEVWLRKSDRIHYESIFREHAPRLGVEVGEQALRFVDRVVILARGTADQLSRSLHLLAAIAELRGPKASADFFTGMDRREQREWIEDAVGRLVPPDEAAPAVCLLDTGLNHGHPLLAPAASAADMHTYHRSWGADDRCGHGTPMGGLALYGDLTDILAAAGPIQLSHRLESVKVTPGSGYHQDPPLYGVITAQSVDRVEVAQPARPRAFCLALTTPDDRDRGRPSSWSAAVDALAASDLEGQQRLILVAAGNTDPGSRHLYPDSNLTDGVHDPGQAWNVLTVGAYTEKADLDPVALPGWQPVAPPGDLAPASCTSVSWGRDPWPVKPDIVMEGGNMALDPVHGTADYQDALQLLSTGHHHALGKQLVSFGDTSAAVALAARLAAMVQAQYPAFWPETIRALLVHSARWTTAMQGRFAPLNSQQDKRNLLRYCGYGVPDPEDLLWSARDALTLIDQGVLQPFIKESGRVATRDINLHAIPWPVEVLRDLQDTPVEMRVTLSYFIEPNPGRRGWSRKFSYQSHGLRFNVKRPLESLDGFRQRVNRLARDEEYDAGSVADSGEWFLGERLRTLGSVHSDIRKGTASELAERGHVAVYPVHGWWKERPALERWHQQARYTLVISIRTPGVEADICTPVVAQIAAQVAV